MGTLTSVASSLLFPSVLGAALDAEFTDHSARVLPWLVVLVLIRSFATALTSFCRARSAAQSIVWLRTKLISRVLTSQNAVDQKHPAGDVMSRLLGSTEVVAHSGYEFISYAIAALGGAYVIVALWLLYYPLALILCGTAALALLLSHRGSTKSYPEFGIYQRAQSALSAALTDATAGISTIWVSRTQRVETARVLSSLPTLATAGQATWQVAGRVNLQRTLLTGLGEVAVLIVAGVGVVQGRLQPGQLVEAVAFMAVGVPYLSQLGGIGFIPETLSSANRVSDLLKMNEASDTIGTVEPQPTSTTHELRLRNVWVTRDSRSALEAIDLSFPAGSSVAVVGRPGSGKTTLGLVLGGVLSPERGIVTCRGRAVRPGDVAFAFERPRLVGETLWDALTYGRETVPSREIINSALENARAASLVRGLPLGLRTPLADVQLSAGELQRLGVARMLIHNCPVAVLDDAVSSLDAVTESQVVASVESALEGRVRVWITYREPLAAQADLTVWLENGRVRAVGPHAELWNHSAYRELFSSSLPRTSRT
ncbi:ATP-binding cassette domain-containing protein [Streptomyces cadmiisoli]|uniref:ATP-binding cassette domain-containing protein n=1 Tax=Streptomyces cadmiisoli TaxID=2184053 RepID=UPI0013A6D372|nr:ABC transporter ATP-binding protein [Streptomyces cadmiisoli]